MRIFIPLSLIALFLLWALYRLLIKKDLWKNRNSFFAGLTFIITWGLIYCFVLA